MMNSEIQSAYVRELPNGIEIRSQLKDRQLFFCFVLAAPDLESIADFIPTERFADSRNVHASSLDSSLDSTEEISAVIGNMADQDTAVFFCADLPDVQEGLAFLNYTLTDSTLQ